MQRFAIRLEAAEFLDSLDRQAYDEKVAAKAGGQGEIHGVIQITHLGRFKHFKSMVILRDCISMVILRDFPYNSALFGLVR